jgi:putative ABC transport system permease protein
LSSYAFWTAVWQGLLSAIMALGVYVSFRVIRFPDLTCDGTYPLGAAVASVLILQEINPYVATVVALLAGCSAGMLTGILNTKFKIPAIVSSILVMTGLYSVNLLIMQKPILSLSKEDTVFAPIYSLQSDGSISVAGFDISLLLIPVCFLAVIVLLKLFLDWLLSTNFGVSLRIAGSNSRLASSLSINPNTMTLTGLALGNGLIALSGALFAQSQRFSDVNLGFGMVVVGLASVFIAEGIETQFFKKAGIAVATALVILGAVIYKLAVAMAYEAGLKAEYFNLLTSGIVFLSLLIPSIRKEIGQLIRR